VVDALIAAVRASYPDLSHRYYRLKAAVREGPAAVLDRNAPLPGDDDRAVTWERGASHGLGAYRAFSPELAASASGFSRRAGSTRRVGRAGAGRFAHPNGPGRPPYSCSIYQGKTRDVMTLGARIGHGVHQVLAGPKAS